MPFLDKLPQPPIKLRASWFSKVRDRIEETVPIEGDYIEIKARDIGREISVDIDALLERLRQEGVGEMQSYIINICKNGQPDTLELYGPPDQ